MRYVADFAVFSGAVPRTLVARIIDQAFAYVASDVQHIGWTQNYELIYECRSAWKNEQDAHQISNSTEHLVWWAIDGYFCYVSDQYVDDRPAGMCSCPDADDCSTDDAD